MIKRFQEFNGHYHDINIHLLEKFNYDLINEGLIKSVDYDKACEKLNNLLKKYKLRGRAYIYPSQDRVQIDIYSLDFLKKKKEFFNNFKSLLNLLGYYVSSFAEPDGFSKKRDIDISDIVENDLNIWINKKYDYKKGIPEKLYHVTYKKHLNKIHKEGLVPKSKSIIENHPDRIYLFFDEDDAKNYTVLRDLYSDKSSEFILLEIDTKLIKKLKLYEDPKFGKDILAIYTYDNISPNSIKIIEEL